MSLSFPSRIGPSGQSSLTSEQNLNKLLRVDSRGNKSQVATSVALEYLRRSQSLSPGYFDGLKSWAKSGCIYALAGAATVGVIGGIGYAIKESGYGLHVLAGGVAAGLLSLGFEPNPIASLSTLLALAVRDSAQRAANSSMKGDERVWDAKEKEVQKCHEEILKQLQAVYNDCGQYLYDQLHQSDRLSRGDGRILLKRTADKLEERIPTIEKLLGQLDLSKPEIENILQTLKTSIRYIQTESCKLLTAPGSEKLNAEMIANWSRTTLHEIAIPFAIKERVAAAKSARFGIVDECQGYGSAALSGTKTLVALAASLAVIAASVHAYQYGGTIQKIQDLFQRQSYLGVAVPEELTGWSGAGAALAVAVPSAAVVAKKGMDHRQASLSNSEYVEEEIAACKNDLKTIYNGVERHLRLAPMLAPAIRERLPAIRNEIRKLGFDPSEILGNLERC